MIAILLGGPAGCSDPPDVSGTTREQDPRRTCIRSHPVPETYAPIVRALCAELHDAKGVSASVAIAEGDRIVWSIAIGPRCAGLPETLAPETIGRIGSITKLVTAALVLAVARRLAIDLDQPLDATLPELGTPAPTLRTLLSHTSGLRDVPAPELFARGDDWMAAIAKRRVPAGAGPHGHAYANANYLVLGQWLQRVTGQPFASLLASEPALAPVRSLMRLEVDAEDGAACGHRRGLFWYPVPLHALPPLPAYTLPAGGGLASAVDLARLPQALARTGLLAPMTATRIPTDRPQWDAGLGVRMQGHDDAMVLGHSGLTDDAAAELLWSGPEPITVVVTSTTPQPLKATLQAARTVAFGR